MARYRKFTYNAGYIGTTEEEIFKFSDSCTDAEIESIYEDWYEAQRRDSGENVEISEDKALEFGVDEDWT